jgi:hypothetical protein
VEEGVTRRVLAEAGAGVLCVALAIVAILLARDVWHVDDAMRAADARAGVAQVEPEAWEANATLPFELAPRLLGLADDIGVRELHARGRTLTGRTAEDEEDPQYLAVRAELVSVSRGADRVRASQAANLLGVLALGEPDEPEKTLVERAIEEFVRAVHLDPRNEVAKENLELMLVLAAEGDETRRGRSGAGQAAGSGAGLQAPGEGW